MIRWWKDLSVSKKLYGVVGIMALLIAAELFTLLFAMNTLSAVRSLVQGEGSWSKAQKDAVQSLQNYVVTSDESYYRAFQKSLEVPAGDRRARNEMYKADFNMNVVMEGFTAGNIHPADVPGTVKLLRRFHNNAYIAKALEQWNKGDLLLAELMERGDRIHAQLKLHPSLPPATIKSALLDISELNSRITVVEDGFSSVLSEASRWLERGLMLILILVVITVESSGLFLTVSFGRNLNRVLKELMETAVKVGSGDFNQTVPVHSRDELGQLAEAINRMTQNLSVQTHERLSAEQASKAKNLFLANMSHEIRTPLNSILGFSELLRDPTLPSAEREKYFDIVKRTGKNLATIINDILDLTKVEAEQMQVEKARFSLKQLMTDLELLLKLRSEEAGIQLEFRPVGDVSEWIISDPIRLRQILTNVIGNAIKFTRRGSVTVTYQVEGTQLLFTVQDTGGGIPPAQIENLFKPFSQGDSSVRKKFGGTGLGLVLSRRLAQLLGGDVGLKESVAGVGSTFYASIAYEPAPVAKPETESPRHSKVNEVTNRIQGKRILVVEDTIDSQLLLQLYLNKSGAEVDVANNGQEGVEKALSGHYDVVLMDMQMPVMDGYAATSHLRDQGYQTPIVALTGYAMSGDREKALSAGCTDYLSKPVDYEKLLACVQHHASI